MNKQIIQNVLKYIRTTTHYDDFEHNEDTVNMMIRDFKELISNLETYKNKF